MTGLPSILIIDDEESVSMMYAAKFREADIAVFTAQDGLEGIDIARMEQPDLILLDILMPGMDGHDVIKELKEDDAISHIPVIFLTANPENEENIELAQEEGALEFINKQMDIDLLLEKIQVILDVPPTR